MDEETLYFNRSMNNLIGIRGSGKSSILEAIRYALDIELTKEKNEDLSYKEHLVKFVLGRGGKMSTTLKDEHGNVYHLEKTLGDIATSVYKNGEYKPGLKPTAIIKKTEQLRKLWRDEYKLIEDEGMQVNMDQSSIEIKIDFKAIKTILNPT